MPVIVVPYRYPDPDRSFNVIPDMDPTLNRGHLKNVNYTGSLWRRSRTFKAFVISGVKVYSQRRFLPLLKHKIA
jgi:hypothetical protein